MADLKMRNRKKTGATIETKTPGMGSKSELPFIRDKDIVHYARPTPDLRMGSDYGTYRGK